MSNRSLAKLSAPVTVRLNYSVCLSDDFRVRVGSRRNYGAHLSRRPARRHAWRTVCVRASVAATLRSAVLVCDSDPASYALPQQPLSKW
jgi:hypothetical protein